VLYVAEVRFSPYHFKQQAKNSRQWQSRLRRAPLAVALCVSYSVAGPFLNKDCQFGIDLTRDAWSPTDAQVVIR
jgi:hypothetical protein